MTYDESNNILNIYVNGRRFIGRGGNWGFPESNLKYRGREYDVAVGYHADMNFTMIRNLETKLKSRNQVKSGSLQLH